MVVYNLSTKQVTDIVCYDTFAGTELKLYRAILKSPAEIAYEPARYSELIKQYAIKVAKGEQLGDFVARHNKAENVVFFSVMDEATHSLPEDFVKYLKPYGSHIDSLSYRGSYAAALYKGKMIDKVSNSGPVMITSGEQNGFLPEKVEYEVQSAGDPFGNMSVIKIDGFDYSLKSRGINMVVYNLSTKQVTDIVCYDTHAGLERVAFETTKK